MTSAAGAMAFGLFGLGLVVAAPVMVIRRLRLRAGATTTTGTVLASEWDTSTDAGTQGYRLTVRYQVPDGHEFTFEEGGCADADVGGRITVSYDPARPERARVGYSARQMWWTATALAGAGVFFAWMALQFLDTW
jgi:hypothetical protein